MQPELRGREQTEVTVRTGTVGIDRTYVGLGTIGVTDSQPGPGTDLCEVRARAYLLGRNLGQQRLQLRARPVGERAGAFTDEESSGQGPVTRRHCIARRVDGNPFVGIPLRRLATEDWNLVRQLLVQAMAEELLQQRPVPVPGSTGSRHRHQRVLAFERLEGLSPVVPAGECVGERTAHPAGHAGPQEQGPVPCREGRDHLVLQVFGHQRLAAGKRRDVGKAGWLCTPPQSRKAQPGHPALGSVQQVGDLRGLDVQPVQPEQVLRLLRRTRKLGRTHVGNVPGHPQPGRADGGKSSAGQHEAQGRRRVPEDHVESRQQPWVGDLMRLVDHEHDRLLEPGNDVEEAFGEPLVRDVVGRQRPEDVTLPAGGGATNGFDDVGPEDLGFVVVAVERHPGRPPAGRPAQPGRQQHRLAGARGSVHDSHPVFGRGQQQIEQPRAWEYRHGGRGHRHLRVEYATSPPVLDRCPRTRNQPIRRRAHDLTRPRVSSHALPFPGRGTRPAHARRTTFRQCIDCSPGLPSCGFQLCRTGIPGPQKGSHLLKAAHPAIGDTRSLFR